MLLDMNREARVGDVTLATDTAIAKDAEALADAVLN